ncbi:MAG: TetR/AcrR family transcriptional regulator [Clostridia bacterium]|nr:TetR/AcrR family transcriptional regulator [Clostridia bacterium]
MAEEKSKRDLILDAAAVVFAKHGFHNAKMEEIAGEAGVGKGTLYEYFSSKQQLFQELFVNGVEKFINQINTETAKCPGAISKLRKIALLHCHHMINSRDLTRVTMDGHGQLNSDFRRWICEVQAQKTKLIKQIIEEGIASGEFRPDLDSQAAAMAFSGAMASIFHIAIFNDKMDEASLAKQVEEIADVIFKGMQKM